MRNKIKVRHPKTELDVRKSICILVVEDEFILGNYLLQTLESLGYDKTHNSMDYSSAIEKIETYRPQLVLLDIQLGQDYNGLKLAKKLRYQYNIPFIFTTSHSSENILDQAKVLQPYGYLVKPVKKESLITAIEIALYKFAYEEVSLQEQEKVLLLDLAHTLGEVREKYGMVQSISTLLREKLGFTFAALTIWQEDGQALKQFFDVDFHSHFNMAIENPWYGQVKGTPYHELYSYLDPFAVSLEKLIAPYPHANSFFKALNSDISKALYIPLIHQSKKIGLLELYGSDKSNFKSLGKDFLGGITSLVTVALSNIDVNEQLKKRDREKEIRIKIDETIVRNTTWPKRFEGYAAALGELIPSYFISFVLQGNQREKEWHAYEQIGLKELRYWDDRSMTDFLGMDNLLGNIPWSKSAQSRSFSGSQFDALCAQNTFYHLLAQRLELKSLIRIKLSLSNKAKLQISLFSREGASYSEATCSLLNRLLQGNQHVVEKILVSEEIHSLNATLKVEQAYLKHEIRTIGNFDEIIGSSEAITEVFKKVRKVANSDVTVLISGETGTGKELIARAIHKLYDPKDEKPFVKLNCANLPSQLIESELFGHEKGSFTGAVNQRIGKFELANGGTIFLDEIGELPLELQPKLLRVLQEREFERLGGNKTIKLGVRVLAATNRNLKDETARNKFRSDLYYRLNAFEIEIPPLRKRKKDITQLALYFLNKITKKMGKKIIGISNASLKELIEHSWPGNVRELEHTIERAIILNQGEILDTKLNSTNLVTNSSEFKSKTLEEAEKELILQTLKHCKGRIRGIGGAAEHLNIHPATLDSRMKKLGITRKHF